MKYLFLLFTILLIACKPDLVKQDGIDNKVISIQPTEQSDMQNPVRLKGLERIYFQRVSETETLGNLPSNIKSLLPGTLEVSQFSSEPRYAGSDEYGITIRDVNIPVKETDLWLREVIDHTHPRISKLWWAIYSNGRRSDIWNFTANPRRTEDKIISNYQIDSALVTGDGLVTLRVRGTMFRPSGYWQLKGITFTFSPEDGDLSLDRVQNVFTILHGYNVDDTLDIKTEAVVDGRFEHKALDSVTGDLLHECGLWVLVSGDDWQFSWADLEQAAFCVTARPGVQITFRGFDEPSFIERGWKSKK